MEKVDRTHWERAELFEFFSAVSHPFYSVTFRVDVTNLYRYVKERHLSFYYAMGYLVTDAVNSVKNFRYAIRDGEVWLLDERIPSLTDLKPGSEQFHGADMARKMAARNWGCRWRSITASSTVSIWGNSTRNYRPTSTHYKEVF